MPFKSKKQKKTIDAAAHNPAFAKKIGISVADAKKMSKHGKGQTKFEEATDTVEKDEKGNVKSWKHEGDWTKSSNKEGRGKVTNLSDKARRKTAKMTDKEVAEAMVTQGPNKGKQWSTKTPGPTNPNYKPFDKNGIPSPDDGATATPPKAAPKTMKKAEVDTEVDTEVAEAAYSAKAGRAGKDLGKKGKNFEKIAKGAGGGKKGKAIAGKVLKDIRAKHLKESIDLLQQLIAEAKKDVKCTCAKNEDTCKVHSKMKEGLKGGQKKLDVAPPKGKLTGADFKALKGKKKTEEAVDQNKDGKNDFEDVKIARMKAAAKSKSKKVSEAKKEKEPEGLYSKKRFETDSQRVSRLAKEKRQAEKKKEAEKTNESKDVYMESLYQKLQNKLNG